MPVTYKLNKASNFTKEQIAKQEEKVKKVFEQAYNSVNQKYLPIATGLAEKPKNYAQLVELKNQLATASGKAFKQVQESVIDSVGKTAKAVVNEYADIFSKSTLNIKEKFVHVPKDTVKAIANGEMYDPPMKLSTRIWGMNQKVHDDLNYIVAQGVALQKPTYDIAKDLEKYVQPDAKKDWAWSKVYPGTSKRIDYNAQRLARTSITHGYQYSVKTCAEDDPFIAGIEWLSANNDRVCPICAERNGKVYKPDELPLDHPNGQCTMALYYEKSLEQIANEISSELQQEIENLTEETEKQLEQLTKKDIVASVPEKKVKVPTFTWYQNEYLGKYGYSVDNMPGFAEWFNDVSLEDLDKIQKHCEKLGYADLETFFEKKLGKVKYKTQVVSKVLNNGDEMSKIAEELNAAKQALNEIKPMKLSNIWLEDVTLADYPVKKDAIPKKLEYFKEQIEKSEKYLKSFPPDSSYATTIKSKITQFNQCIDDLAEYEKQGEKYMKAMQAVNELQQKQNKILGKTLAQFDDADFTDNAKKTAKRFTKRNKADSYLRPQLDRQWTQLSEQQKYSVWQYTEGSGGYNRPLSGYDEIWSRNKFKGVGNVSLSNENANRFVPSAFEKFTDNGIVDYRKSVQNLTTAIEQTAFEDAMYLSRGSDIDGLAGLLEGDQFTYEQAMEIIRSGDVQKMKQVFTGQEFTNHAYTSTGIAQDAGFRGKVKYEIYCPKGTKGIYAEPQSAYGYTSRNSLYQPGMSYNSVGKEAEMILQRGTTFRITDVTEEYGTIKVKMEVVYQPDYFKTGLEQTINGGATSF